MGLGHHGVAEAGQRGGAVEAAQVGRGRMDGLADGHHAPAEAGDGEEVGAAADGAEVVAVVRAVLQAVVERQLGVGARGLRLNGHFRVRRHVVEIQRA